MGKLSKFAIVFDNNCTQFHPGQKVYGSVVMALSEPMEMKGIRINVQGKGWCQWSQTVGQSTSVYGGSENLFAVQAWIHGNSTKFTNDAGRFSYRFYFVLPSALPSSFEGPHGFIRYHIFAEIVIPWAFNHKTGRKFTVFELIDTNLPIYNSVRPSSSNDKDVGCCCCYAGPLELTASIDRKAYCSGEHILITAMVQNNTNREMYGMKAELYQYVQYIGKSFFFRENKLTVKKISIVKDGQSCHWKNQPLLIPVATPTSFKSKVIKVWYALSVEIDVSWGFNLTATLYVTMGTVPHSSSQSKPCSSSIGCQTNPALQNQTPSLAAANQLSPVIDQQPVNPKLLSQPLPKNYGSMN
ncbi:arrestin domain-containing protein 3 isoform X1 [Hydra vulgaris]|uniref:arrestin domain-containing protein 3 isoform X1 n=1 Tax=Hydra vulgaris TaxID=6087 RepID=UPI001F5F3B80|nr:arrestin domain-containing protein 3 isoform X1 [Hydra vulgaris]